MMAAFFLVLGSSTLKGNTQCGFMRPRPNKNKDSTVNAKKIVSITSSPRINDYLNGKFFSNSLITMITFSLDI